MNRDELACQIYVTLLGKPGCEHADAAKCCDVACAAYCAADLFLAEKDRQKPESKPVRK